MQYFDILRVYKKLRSRFRNWDGGGVILEGCLCNLAVVLTYNNMTDNFDFAFL